MRFNHQTVPELTRRVAERSGLTQADTKIFLRTLGNVMIESLAADGNALVYPLGHLKINRASSRPGISFRSLRRARETVMEKLDELDEL